MAEILPRKSYLEVQCPVWTHAEMHGFSTERLTGLKPTSPGKLEMGCYIRGRERAKVTEGWALNMHPGYSQMFARHLKYTTSCKIYDKLALWNPESLNNTFLSLVHAKSDLIYTHCEAGPDLKGCKSIVVF